MLARVNRSTTIVLLLFTSFLPLTAKENPKLQAQGRALIEGAIKTSNLLDPSVGPIVLRGSSNGEAVEYRIAFYWSAPNFRAEDAGSSEGEFLVGNANTVWQKRRPTLPYDLHSVAWRIADFTAGMRHALTEKVVRIRDRKIKGVLLKCVMTEGKDVRERELCFDPGGGVLISMIIRTEMAYPFGGPPPHDWQRFFETTVNYKEYESYKGVFYPKVVETVHENGVPSVRRISSVERLSGLSESMFSPEADALTWEWCADMDSAAPQGLMMIKSDDPIAGVKKASVRVVITEEGKLTDWVIVSEQRPKDGAKVLAYIASQKFTPAKCGDHAIRSWFVFDWKGFGK